MHNNDKTDKNDQNEKIRQKITKAVKEIESEAKMTLCHTLFNY